jgi:hypothetical protein
MRTGKAYQPTKARIPFGGNSVPGNLAHRGSDDLAEGATPVKLTQLEDRDGGIWTCYTAYESTQVGLAPSGNPEWTWLPTGSTLNRSRLMTATVHTGDQVSTGNLKCCDGSLPNSSSAKMLRNRRLSAYSLKSRIQS